MPTIVDYASLSQAIQDFTHRASIAPYVDYFIQGAQELITGDIFDKNFGQGIRYMENAYPATAIATNGTAPVPSDWLAPKLMTLTDSSADTFSLQFKDPEWIYARYPNRNPDGLPNYIARDLLSGGGAFSAVNSSLSITATAAQTVFSLAAGPTGAQVLFVTLDGAMLVPTTDYSISGTTLTLVSGALLGQTLFVQYLATSVSVSGSSTSVFIFGPFPDFAYTIQGTYYQAAPLLSSGQTTNWMVLNAPYLLHAACMRKASQFVKDGEALQMWEALYNEQLEKFIMRDTAERYGVGPLVINAA